jgi:hypothetical protein
MLRYQHYTKGEHQGDLRFQVVMSASLPNTDFTLTMHSPSTSPTLSQFLHSIKTAGLARFLLSILFITVLAPLAFSTPSPLYSLGYYHIHSNYPFFVILLVLCNTYIIRIAEHHASGSRLRYRIRLRE